MKRDGILFLDFDGTLAADTHRAHLRPKSVDHRSMHDIDRNELERYMEGALLLKDMPMPCLKTIVDIAVHGSWAKVGIVSARFKHRMPFTKHWLNLHCRALSDVLDFIHHRANDEFELPAVVVKTRMILDQYAEFAKGSFIRATLIDDDPNMRVVARIFGFEALNPEEL